MAKFIVGHVVGLASATLRSRCTLTHTSHCAGMIDVRYSVVRRCPREDSSSSYPTLVEIQKSEAPMFVYGCTHMRHMGADLVAGQNTTVRIRCPVNHCNPNTVYRKCMDRFQILVSSNCLHIAVSLYDPSRGLCSTDSLSCHCWGALTLSLTFNFHQCLSDD